MKHHAQNTLSYYTYDIFDQFPNLVAATFTRKGGVSTGPFSSLNVSWSATPELNVGETRENVIKNTEIVRKALSPQLKMVKSWQVHGDQIVKVTHKNCHENFTGDSLITNEPNIGLLIKHADCQVGIFYDIKNHALGVSHSGWKGSVLNIYKKTIEAMKENYGTCAKDLLVAISPSLGPCHSEFKNYLTEFPKEFWNFQTKPNYFDLWALSKNQLIDAGILPASIEIAKMCTYAHSDEFFSYRREKISGRNGTIAYLK
ncbi:MAG: peptidoglycan editing factor PgeF [Parachlamydiales bacterium]|nr:peptidoglycan editing factor PgeF [Parachlamydiales bacterium]